MLAPDFDGMDEMMKAESRWVLWRLDWKNDRWAKVPYQPSGRRARTNDRATWSSFAAAAIAYTNGRFDGIGFVLGDGWVGGDIDGCRNPQGGEINSVAQELLSAFTTYADVSPSGTGAKWIGRGKWHSKQNRKVLPNGQEVEVYSAGRYFTVTGNRIGSHSVHDIQESLDRLADQLFGESGAAHPPIPTVPEQPVELDDEALVPCHA
jgi:putative DNA primase/helicase